MTLHTYHAHGSLSWADIGSTDLPATTAFYCQLFGWETSEAPNHEESGGYGFFQLNGHNVAGYGPAHMPGVWWATYFATDDINDTVARVLDHGGAIIVPAMQVMDAGHMAVCADPSGAAFSLWQSGDHCGAQLTDEPGSLCWAELMTRDLDEARRFYPAVFGWTLGEPGDYQEFQLNGVSIGGLMAMPEMMPAEVPPNWGVYFAVADLNDSIDALNQAGGQVMFGPQTAGEAGTFVTVCGPLNEVFSLIQLNTEG